MYTYHAPGGTYHTHSRAAATHARANRELMSNLKPNTPVRVDVTKWRELYQRSVANERTRVDGKEDEDGGEVDLNSSLEEWRSVFHQGPSYSTRLNLRPGAVSDYYRHFQSTKDVCDAYSIHGREFRSNPGKCVTRNTLNAVTPSHASTHTHLL